MNNTDQASTFQLSLVDVVCGILLGILFDRYQSVTGFYCQYLFFFTVIVVISHWYWYRCWCETEMKSNQKTLLPDVVADLALVFTAFQLSSSYDDPNPRRYVTWFMVAYVVEFGWLFERIVSRRRIRHTKIDPTDYYWLVPNPVILVLLLSIYYLIVKLSFPHWLVLVALTGSFVASIAADSIVEKCVERKKARMCQQPG